MTRLQRLIHAAREMRDLIDDSEGVHMDGYTALWEEMNEAKRLKAAVAAFDDVKFEEQDDD